METPKPTDSQPTKPLPELRAWLERTGTTQEDLARMLKVSGAQISRFLSGSRNFGMETAVKLALLTEIPVEKLLTDGRAIKLLKLLGEQSTSYSDFPKDKSSVT